MNTNESIFHPEVTARYIQDCLNYSVLIRFDRMPDNSWQRISSDKPISWVSQNLNRIISSSLEIKQHTMKDETLRWNSDKHIEVTVELREGINTYLFSAEMAFEHLDHFRNYFS